MSGVEEQGPLSGPPVHMRCSWCIACCSRLPAGTALCAACAPDYRRRRREELLAAARTSIPAAYRHLRLDHPELRLRVPAASTELLDAARAYTTSARVVLLGASGEGKTSVACAMLSTLIDDGSVIDCTARVLERARHARFVDALALRKAVAEHPLGAGEAPMLEDARYASVLLLDDLGKDLELRTAINPVPELVRYRHMNELPTWVTTNLGYHAMANAYDASHARRVFFDGPPPLCLGELP